MIYNEITNDELHEENVIHKNTNKGVIYKIIIVSIITFFTSQISLLAGVNPIPYVMLGVGSVFNVPLLLIAAISSLSLLLFGESVASIISFLVTFILFTFITSMLNVNGLSIKYSVLIKLLISMIIIFAVKVLFLGDSLLNNVMLIVTAMLIYLVYVYGTSVLLNIKKGYVFTEEENIAAICMLTFLLSIFSNIQLYGIRISSILLIMIVLIYGYRKGAILGCVCGFVTGLIMSILTGVSEAFLITLAFGGLISGFMNKIGRVATVIGFLAGSLLIGYLLSDFSHYVSTVSEIMIAAIPVMFFPKNIKIKLEEFFNINKTLNKPYDNLLDVDRKSQEKMSVISDVIANMTDFDANKSQEDKVEFRDILKKYILEYIREVEVKSYSIMNKVDREKIEICADYLSNKLEQNDEITEDMIMFECENKKKFIENIKDIYSSIKIMRILRRKEEEMQKNASNEYKKLSSIISQLSSETRANVVATNQKDIKNLREELRLLGYRVYEDELIVEKDYIEYTFITDILSNIDNQKKEIVSAVSNILGKNMKIRLLLNISKTEKSKIKLASVTEYFVDGSFVQRNKVESELNGDSCLTMNFGINKYISVLSDGAGSGQLANASSKKVVDNLEKLIKAGFDENKAYEIINTMIGLKEDDTNFASLDIAIFNLESADASFVKFGAAPTYILSEDKVITITSMNLPVGVVSENDYVPIVKKLNNDDIVVQISDGALIGENNLYDNYFTSALLKLDKTKDANALANNILDEVIKNKENLRDDITIIVSKIKASKSID